MSAFHPTMLDFIAKSPVLSFLPDFINNNITEPILNEVRSLTSDPSSIFFDQTGQSFVAPYPENFNSLLDIVNNHIKSPVYQPDINGYVFVLMLPPDLSGLTGDGAVDVKKNVIDLCKSSSFFALDFTPPAITINTESINTQASISMPYATTKIATGEMSVSYLDDRDMNVNAMHNLWIEYLYNQLWGDFPPAKKYITPGDPSFGALDYATTMYIVKYSANVEEQSVPTMIGKATGVFPLGLPTKETIGVRTSNDLVMQTINYTCAYYEVVHPMAHIQTYSKTLDGMTILDEANSIISSLEDRLQVYYN